MGDDVAVDVVLDVLVGLVAEVEALQHLLRGGGAAAGADRGHNAAGFVTGDGRLAKASGIRCEIRLLTAS